MAVSTLYDFYKGQGQALPTVQERSKLYTSAGLGTGYQGTAQQNTALLGYLQKTGIPTTVNATDLTNPKEVVIPSTQNVDTTANLMAGVNATTDQIAKTAAEQKAAQEAQLKAGIDAYTNSQMLLGTNPLETKQQSLVTGLETLQGQQLQASKEKANLYQTSTADLQKQLADLNLQSAQLRGAYEQGLVDTEGKVIPMQFITGQQAQLQKQYAVKSASNAYQQLALQGNITAAKDLADQTIAAKYGNLEQQIANQKSLIDANYSLFSASEKKRADALNYALDQQAKQIEADKETEKNIFALAIKAADNGADASTLQAINNAKDYSSAITAAKDYLSLDTTKFTQVGTDENGKPIMGFVDEASRKVYDVQGNDITTNPTTNTSPTEGSISYRTNNPGNIKWTGAAWQTALGATNSGIKASDGGTFAKFPSLEAGTQAQQQLLTSGSYANLTVDAAMKRWSNNGYGAEVSSINGGKLMKDLTPNELSILMADMKEREGYFAPTAPTADNLTDQERYFYDSLKQRRQKYSQLTAADKKIADAAFRKMNEVMPRQLSMTEETAQTSALDGLNAVQTLRDMANNNEMPLLRSYIFGDTAAGRFLGTSQFEQAKKTASDIITRIRTGAALNESEVKFYQTMTPSLGDTQEDITKKLNNLYALYAGISGLPVVVSSPDGTQQVEFNDLYSPLQRQGLRDALKNNWTPQ